MNQDGAQPRNYSRAMRRGVLCPLDRAKTKMTLAEKLDHAGNRPSGFDYLRILLALGVMSVHIPYLKYGTELGITLATSGLGPIAKSIAQMLRPWTGVILPMFFALSGFLVAGSLERCRTLRAFIGLRILRIFPALAVETVISALIIGPLFTDLQLRDYFANPLFSSYFLNLTGAPQYFLPGVFSHAPHDNSVNGQLWSVPYELLCYVAIIGLALAGIKRWRPLTLLLTIATMLGFTLRQQVLHGWTPTPTVPTGFILIWSFLVGAALYLMRERVSWSAALAVLSFGCIAISLREGYWTYLMPFGVAYLTIFLGLANPARLWLLEGADYSYGVYLYHFVIIQAVADRLPRLWYINAAISFPLVIAVAATSWHLVERRALALRIPLMEADKRAYGLALTLSSTVGLALLIFGFFHLSGTLHRVIAVAVQGFLVEPSYLHAR
jgi:peptidoglycan/LPS O-acetylase OafA/YrhL